MIKLKFVSDKADYFNQILSIIKKSKKKVCYMTLNKSSEGLREKFKKAGLKEDKFYFVDCITSTIKTPKHVKNTKFISVPYDLGRIRTAIMHCIEKGHCLVIFDSLSNLLTYEAAIPSGGDILKEFVEYFLPELEKKKGDVIFICKSKDKNNEVIKEAMPVFK